MIAPETVLNQRPAPSAKRRRLNRFADLETQELADFDLITQRLADGRQVCLHLEVGVLDESLFEQAGGLEEFGQLAFDDLGNRYRRLAFDRIALGGDFLFLFNDGRRNAVTTDGHRARRCNLQGDIANDLLEVFVLDGLQPRRACASPSAPPTKADRPMVIPRQSTTPANRNR